MKNAKECVNVSCPSTVSTYNKFMGGVDLVDSLLNLYIESTFDQKSGQHLINKMFLHVLDFTVVQSWHMYCRSIAGNEGKLKLRKFKIILPNSKMRAGKSTSTKRRRPSLSDVDKQFQAKKVV